jgi:hypothetical protein
LLRGLVRGGLEVVECADLRGRRDQGPSFGADSVVGGEHAGTGVTRNILAIHIIEDRIAGAEFQDHALVRAFAGGIAQRAGAA